MERRDGREGGGRESTLASLPEIVGSIIGRSVGRSAAGGKEGEKEKTTARR